MHSCYLGLSAQPTPVLSCSFSATRLPAGDHAAILQFFDAEGRAIADLTRRVNVHVEDPARDTVVILSELKR